VINRPGRDRANGIEACVRSTRDEERRSVSYYLFCDGGDLLGCFADSKDDFRKSLANRSMMVERANPRFWNG